jgi:hypothetical protein
MRFLAVACLVAYETDEFEGGREVSFPPYALPPTDSLPRIVDYEPPGDFGSIAFEYVDTADTVFYGSIVWAGRGEMLVPDTLG